MLPIVKGRAGRCAQAQFGESVNRPPIRRAGRISPPSGDRLEAPLKTETAIPPFLRNAYASMQKSLDRMRSTPPDRGPEREPVNETILRDLLQLAGIPPSDKKAAKWLEEAVQGARSVRRLAKKRPLPADHNDHLVKVSKRAKDLIKELERLRLQPLCWDAFWTSGVFSPVSLNQLERPDVISTLENIARAAEHARDRRWGPPGKAGKQHVVDFAFAFFARFSPKKPSGTPTGAFAKFAREFYGVVTGADAEKDGGLDRQIRQAAARLQHEHLRST